MVMPTVVGIMGHSIQTLSLVFKSLLSTEPWLHDPYILPIPWRDTPYDQNHRASGSSLSFGFMKHDGLVTPHPPIGRALRIVERALLVAGHNVNILALYFSF